MASVVHRGKDLRVLYRVAAIASGGTREGIRMLGLAMAMFIALFGFGEQFLGWSDPAGKVQLGLFMAFLFGMICGYRAKG